MRSSRLLILGMLCHVLFLNFCFAQQPTWPIAATVANYNQINATFAEKHSAFHGGLDLHIANNSDFVAILAGEVEDDAAGSGGGNTFFVTGHSYLISGDPSTNLKRVRYGDNTDPLTGIMNGSAIASGQAIGEIVSGGHLHFEMWIRDCLNCDWYLVDPLDNPYANYQNPPPGTTDAYDVELNDIVLEPQDANSGIIFTPGNGLTAWHHSSCKIHKEDRPDSQGSTHAYNSSNITAFGNILPTIHVRDTEVTNGTNSTGEGLGIYECIYYIDDAVKYWVKFDELEQAYKSDWATFFNHKYNTATGNSVLYGNHDYIKMHRRNTDQYSAPHKVIDRGIWRTRGKSGSAILVTDVPKNTEYPDGCYEVDFSVLDAAGNRDDASNRIRVDNFQPFITNFNLTNAIPGSTIFDYNRIQDEHGTQQNDGLIINVSSSFDDDVVTSTVINSIYASEDMRKMEVRYKKDGGIWTGWSDMEQDGSDPLRWNFFITEYTDGCYLFNYKGRDKSNNPLINVYELTNENTLGNNTPIPTRNTATTWHNNPASVGEDFFYTCTPCATEINGIRGEISMNRFTSDCDDIVDFEELIRVDCNGNVTVELVGLHPNYLVGWQADDGLYYFGTTVHNGQFGDNCFRLESSDGCCAYEGCIEVTESHTYIETNFEFEFVPGFDNEHRTLTISTDSEDQAFPICVTFWDTDDNEICGKRIISSISSVASCSNFIIGEQYCIVFEDANGCSQEYCFTTEGQTCPGDLNVSVENIMPECGQSGDGSISISVIPGDCEAYSVSWDNGETGTEISDLSAGTYCVTVQGEAGCEECRTVKCFDVSRDKDCEDCEDEIVITGVVTDISVCTDWVAQVSRLLSGKLDYSISGGTGNYTVNVCYENPVTGITEDLGDQEGTVIVSPWKYGDYCVKVTDDCGNEAMQCFGFWVVVLPDGIPSCNKKKYWFFGEDEEYDANMLEPGILEGNSFEPSYRTPSGYWTLRRVEDRERVIYALVSEKTDYHHMYIEINKSDRESDGRKNALDFETEDKPIMNQSIEIQMNAYPNPFTQSFKIDISAAKAYQGTLMIHDVLGNTYYKKDISLDIGIRTIDMNDLYNLPKGVLFVTFTSGKTAKTVSVIKQ